MIIRVSKKNNKGFCKGSYNFDGFHKGHFFHCFMVYLNSPNPTLLLVLVILLYFGIFRDPTKK